MVSVKETEKRLEKKTRRGQVKKSSVALIVGSLAALASHSQAVDVCSVHQLVNTLQSNTTSPAYISIR